MSRRHNQGSRELWRGSWRGGSSGSWRRQEQSGSTKPDIDYGSYLTVRHPRKYQGKAPTLDPPKVLGFFSVDSEKNIHYDDSMMPVLSSKYTPEGKCMKVDMDLNRGWHRVIGYTCSSSERLGLLLQWILKNQKELTAEDSSDRLMVDIVCSRGLLKKIMQAPYAQQSSHEWVIFAKYFKGAVYMRCESEDAARLEEKVDLLGIYGHKFEQYMTGGDPDDVLECNCQFRCVLQLHLNELSLLFAPDTDAVDMTRHKDNFKDMSSFVRLKATKEQTEPFKLWSYRKFTLNAWWIENILTGVPRLLVGTRNPEGVVHTLKMLQTADLPSQAEGQWEPSVCINFLVKFLNFVKEKAIAEPDQVHQFERSSSAVHCIRHSHNPNMRDILPSWYTQQLFVTQDEESSWGGAALENTE